MQQNRKYQDGELFEEEMHNTSADPTTLDYINAGVPLATSIIGLFTKKPSTTVSAGNPSPVIVMPPAATPAKGLSTGAIVGIAAGGVLLLGLIIVLAIRK